MFKYRTLVSRLHSRTHVVVVLLLVCLLFLVAGPVTLAHAHVRAQTLVGPKRYYLALGDSLAFGYQPDLDFKHGYADDFFGDLKSHGVQSLANMGCPGETSTTMIQGGCPVPVLRKFPYVGAQLNAALAYLKLHGGQVSPVTLDIGANDLMSDLNSSTCTIDTNQFNTRLAQLDANLTQIILPKLHAALMVNGVVTGDLVMTNYYDPFENTCPDTLPFTQIINQHLANDVSGYGIIVDTFDAFDSATVPDPFICTYTWICSAFKDIHATDKGYSVMAGAFESGTGY